MGTHVDRRKAGLFARSATLLSWLALASCASDPPPPAATPATQAAPVEAPPNAEAPAEATPPVAQEPATPEPECQAVEDCGKAKGDAPAGSEWLCEAGACTTRILPEPVKAEPAAEKPKARKGSKKGAGDKKAN